MDRNQTQATGRVNAEADILSQIVDAMLAAESDLLDASEEQWSRTLVASCRQQKQLARDNRLSMASTC
jgi:hypothetical protein